MIYLELFYTFFMIGAFTFGGGYAMLPLIQEQVGVRWGDVISQQSMIDFVAVSESTPGPFAINMATYIGSEMGGVFGSFCATLGVVLPSFMIILIVAKCYDRFKESHIVKGCMTGLKPAVVGLIGNAVLGVLMTVFFPAGISLSVFTGISFYIYAAIFGVMLLLALKKVHPILIICLSAVIGIAVGYLGF
ncbi:MAG: chromate transporter [Oscillospiraceae bacterium]|nr:chromate transporter [Oscillospiraceae bacterium]